ncbi:hypothetical protein ACFV16_38415, partial [Streptomyces massasporeus]
MDVRGLGKRYGGPTAVDGIGLGIRRGEVRFVQQDEWALAELTFRETVRLFAQDLAGSVHQRPRPPQPRGLW